ncbi:spherulation-specific family 4 protein [Geodermatophilus sp. URMC 60]
MLAAVSYYFPGGSKWEAVSDNVDPRVMAWLIINPNSGPGYGRAFTEGGSTHTAYTGQIVDSQRLGHTVLAYVTTNYHDHQLDVQRQFWFAASHATDSFTALREDGSGNLQPVEHGLPAGFGPVWVTSEGALPSGLTERTNYWVIPDATAERFRLADSQPNALAGNSEAISTDGGGRHMLGISRSPENIQNVRDEIDLYLQRYPTLQGFFFDEMHSGDADDEGYYGAIYAYVHDRGLYVVQNPGTDFPEPMIDLADTFMSFEGKLDSYMNFTPPSWQANHPATKFWHCIKNVSSADYCAVYARWRAFHAEYLWIDEAAAEYTAPPSYLPALEELEAGLGDGGCPGV